MGMQNLIDCQESFKVVKNRVNEGKNWKENILKDIEVLKNNPEYLNLLDDTEKNDIDLLENKLKEFDI